MRTMTARLMAGICALLAGTGLAGITAPAVSAATSITVVQTGAGAPYHGLYWVNYPQAGRISGTVAGAATGTPVVLYASRWPFRSGYASISHTTTASGGTYSFSVKPATATRYRVGVGSARSRTVIFYVQAESKFLHQTSCLGKTPTCDVTASYLNWIPRNVFRQEIRKPAHFYLGVHRGSLTPPTRLFANRAFRLRIKRVSADKARSTVKFTVNGGPGLYEFQWVTCTRQTESADGFGLPVHTGCGKPSVPNKSEVLAVLQ